MADVEGPAADDRPPRPDQVLGLAIERSYQVFARNHVGPTMVVRRGDVGPEDVAALAGPVRSVPAVAIDRWLPHAVTTWGTGEDVRALLPRVFELLAAGLLATPPEVIFAKIRQADPSGWPIDEVGAMDDVVAALWLATLAQHPAAIGQPAVRLLAAIAELGGDLSPYLDDWLLLVASERAGDGARRHLADVVRQVEHLRAADQGLEGLFWSPRPAEVERLERWVTSPLVTAHVRR